MWENALAANDPKKPPYRRFFDRFVHSEVAGSCVLLATTIIALVWANSPWSGFYLELIHADLGISWDGHVYTMSLEHWIADGLMVIFFFVVGLEIKREIVVGQLSTFRDAVLPVGAALGGAIVPALLYFVLNPGEQAARGWGVPMATDIAFALGILALFGKRVPLGLKVFLTALAIADDLMAVLVIAVFYTETINIVALAVAAVFLLLIVLAGRLGIRQVFVYILLMHGVWVAVLLSGVHATVAGVLIAMLIPVRSSIDPGEFLRRAKAGLAELEEVELTRESPVHEKSQRKALEDLSLAVDDMRPAGITLENQLHPFQSFLILPLFALFKAGVPLRGDAVDALLDPVSLGIIVGLFVGKQLGITLTSWLIVRSGKTSLPDGVTWRQIWGVSCLAGVGFTMSIFISDLAFTDAAYTATAKIGVLAASLLSGVFGMIVLSRVLPKTPNSETANDAGGHS